MHVEIEYPEVVLNIKEIKVAIDIGDTVGETLEKSINEIDQDLSIKTAMESGITRREKILQIKPLDTSNLEERRMEVLMRWWSSPLYTETTLRQKLNAVLGQNNYALKIDLNNKVVECQVEIVRKNMLKSIENLFDQMVPLDYLVSVVLRYNQYKKYKPYTYKQLKIKTYSQLRSEEVDFEEDS